MPNSLERAFRENRWTGIGAVAVIVGVIFAYASLRKASPPVVIAGGADTGAGTGTSDLSAFTAGASAAGSGFDTGAALGQGALGLAGSVVSDIAGMGSTLAWSQAQVAASATSDLAAAYAAFIDRLQPDPGNPPPDAVIPSPVAPLPIPSAPVPVPAPAPAPAPAPWWPSGIGTPPASALGAIVIPAGSLQLYAVSGTTASVSGSTTTGGFTAWYDRIASFSVSGTATTLVHLISGPLSGRWIRSRSTRYVRP